MKIIFKWAGIWTIPSIILFLFIYSDLIGSSTEQKALFLTLHFMFAGAVVYFTLTELKKKSLEPVSVLRYILTGILSCVSHAIIFGLFSGIYFNYLNPGAKQVFVDEVLEKVVVQSRDSSAASLEEYYERLMADKDTGFLLPETYKAYEQAAADSLSRARQELAAATEQSFGIYYVVLRWVGLAPLVGILFSVIVTVFFIKR
jgi:hypothetical protein